MLAKRLRDALARLNPALPAEALEDGFRTLTRPEEDIEHAVRQIISRAAAPEGVIDIFAAAGLAKRDISSLSEEFLGEVRGMPKRNLAVELLQKLLKGELATRRTSRRRPRRRCWNKLRCFPASGRPREQGA